MGRKLAVIQRIQSLLVSVFLLQLVGATAATSLGRTVCRMLQIDWIPSATLQFAGYLLICNLGRLYPDPADLVNIPIRSSNTEELRAARIGLAFLSAAVLLVWSLLTSRWSLVLAAAFVCYHSAVLLSAGPRSGISIEGSSLCQILLTARGHCWDLVVWPCVENSRSFRLRECLVFVWCLLVLTINSLVFDYRDMRGIQLFGPKHFRPDQDEGTRAIC